MPSALGTAGDVGRSITTVPGFARDVEIIADHARLPNESHLSVVAPVSARPIVSLPYRLRIAGPRMPPWRLNLFEAC